MCQVQERANEGRGEAESAVLDGELEEEEVDAEGDEGNADEVSSSEESD